MKRSLLALAALGTFASVASAQSSVTVFGVVDLAVTTQTSGGKRLVTEDSSQASSNRLGFKGVEDLGGGLSAGFWLEAGMNNNTGTGAETGGGLGFNRRSTVSLVSSTLGEIRLGHDYAPSFWNTVIFDVYGANGIGEGDNIALASTLGSGAGTAARVNNSVAYFLPSNIGGVYGRVTVAPSEAVAGQKYAGGLIGWAGGPIEVAGAYGETKAAVVGGNSYKVWNVGATYDFGFLKLFGLYNENQYTPPGLEQRSLKTAEISTAIPVGLGFINASFTSGKISGLTNPNGDPKAIQFAAQYVYNLSKRTSVYASGSHISNKDFEAGSAGVNFGGTLGINPLAVVSGSDGKSSITGYDIGLRHTF